MEPEFHSNIVKLMVATARQYEKDGDYVKAVEYLLKAEERDSPENAAFYEMEAERLVSLLNDAKDTQKDVGTEVQTKVQKDVQKEVFLSEQKMLPVKSELVIEQTLTDAEAEKKEEYATPEFTVIRHLQAQYTNVPEEEMDLSVTDSVNCYPLGTVVRLHGGTKRLMIMGYEQINLETKARYDYIGCLFPEGIVDYSEFYLFNSEQIEEISFIGRYTKNDIHSAKQRLQRSLKKRGKL